MAILPESINKLLLNTVSLCRVQLNKKSQTYNSNRKCHFYALLLAFQMVLPLVFSPWWLARKELMKKMTRQIETHWNTIQQKNDWTQLFPGKISALPGWWANKLWHQTCHWWPETNCEGAFTCFSFGDEFTKESYIFVQWWLEKGYVVGFLGKNWFQYHLVEKMRTFASCQVFCAEKVALSPRSHTFGEIKETCDCSPVPLKEIIGLEVCESALFKFIYTVSSLCFCTEFTGWVPASVTDA